MDLRFTIYYLLFCLVFLAGCDQPQTKVRVPATPKATRPVQPQKTPNATVGNPPSEITSPPAATGGRDPVTPGSDRGPQLPAGYGPVKIGILPLTEVSGPAGAGQGAKLRVFVAMLDGFGSQVKAPGVLYFELYEYVPRSAQLKGKQLALWPEIDLTVPMENNKCWRDFLRAYEFELDTQAGRDKTYVLEATCTCPGGKRLSAEYVLKGGQ